MRERGGLRLLCPFPIQARPVLLQLRRPLDRARDRAPIAAVPRGAPDDQARDHHRLAQLVHDALRGRPGTRRRHARNRRTRGKPNFSAPPTGVRGTDAVVLKTFRHTRRDRATIEVPRRILYHRERAREGIEAIKTRPRLP